VFDTRPSGPVFEYNICRRAEEVLESNVSLFARPAPAPTMAMALWRAEKPVPVPVHAPARSLGLGATVVPSPHATCVIDRNFSRIVRFKSATIAIVRNDATHAMCNNMTSGRPGPVHFLCIYLGAASPAPAGRAPLLDSKYQLDLTI
jgi:hypothetical protein